MGFSELVCMDGCKQVRAPLLWLNLVQKLWSCATAVLKLPCLVEKLIELCGFQTKAGSWPTSLEHRQSELMSACTHPWSRGTEVMFNITARILFLRIPAIFSEHHTYKPGPWVCLDQKEQPMPRMFQGTWAEGNGEKEDSWISASLQKPCVNSFLNTAYCMTVPSRGYNLVEDFSILNFSKMNSKLFQIILFSSSIFWFSYTNLQFQTFQKSIT